MIPNHSNPNTMNTHSPCDLCHTPLTPTFTPLTLEELHVHWSCAAAAIRQEKHRLSHRYEDLKRPVYDDPSTAPGSPRSEQAELSALQQEQQENQGQLLPTSPSYTSDTDYDILEQPSALAEEMALATIVRSIGPTFLGIQLQGTMANTLKSLLTNLAALDTSNNSPIDRNLYQLRVYYQLGYLLHQQELKLLNGQPNTITLSERHHTVLTGLFQQAARGIGIQWCTTYPIARRTFALFHLRGETHFQCIQQLTPTMILTATILEFQQALQAAR